MKVSSRFFILSFGLTLLAGCSLFGTSQNGGFLGIGGSNESRQYVSTSAEECSRLRFQCAYGMQPFQDNDGCGCEPADEAPKRSEAATSGQACGIIDDREVSCPSGEICAVVDWVSSTDQARCYPTNICENNSCGPDYDCVQLESWPLQVKCVPKENAQTKLYICPDEWIEDQMPQVTPDGQKTGEMQSEQYMIVKGKRHELSEFDLKWVAEQCGKTGPTPVY